jgi:hypothetical protein
MAILTALVAWPFSFWMVSKKKVGWAALGSVVGAIALFIAFPAILNTDAIKADQEILWIIALLGVVITLAAVAWAKFPTVLIGFGITLAMWALFRSVPTFPPAFDHLGANLAKASSITWYAITTFFKEVSK